MQAATFAAPQYSLKIVVSHDAPAAVKDAAASIASSVDTNPLLKIFADGKKVQTVNSEKLLSGPIEDRAYSHLVIVGLMNDPVIQEVWQHEARPIDGGLYVFGFGYLKGDLGYIESDRNPFLHSDAIAAALFEAEIVTITGTSPAGVAAAVKAFLAHDLVNGVVAAGQWSRAEPGLLDRGPLSPDFALPDVLPDKIGDAIRIGITQASEDEYRGVLQDTGVEPAEIWRAKYFVRGAWDGKGWQQSFKAYYAGLHRRAAGNTLWAARFASDDQAKNAAGKIATAAGLKADGDRFVGKQPPFGNNDSPGPLLLWRQGSWVMMSTLPAPQHGRGG